MTQIDSNNSMFYINSTSKETLESAVHIVTKLLIPMGIPYVLYMYSIEVHMRTILSQNPLLYDESNEFVFICLLSEVLEIFKSLMQIDGIFSDLG